MNFMSGDPQQSLSFIGKGPCAPLMPSVRRFQSPPVSGETER